MRQALLLLWLLAGIALAQQEWVIFTPPDRSFSVRMPQQPKVVSDKPEFLIWGAKQPDKFQIMVGSAEPPPDLEDTLKARQEACQVMMDVMIKSGDVKTTVRKDLPAGGVDVLGKARMGEEVQIRTLAPTNKRVFVMVASGPEDLRMTFLSSFKVN
jgi:hypothetical protein